ncbi:MAG: hypothetical protein NXI08_15960 [bacterium]|nr:hypothetical protein [bacterium]
MKEEIEKLVDNPLVSTITNEIPIVSAITNYWRETIRQSREKRLKEFLNNLGKRLEHIEESNKNILDKVHLGSQDYLNLVEQVAEIATKTIDQNKQAYLENFVIAYAKEERLDVNEKDIFISFLIDLTGSHFLIINELYKIQFKLSSYDIKAIKQNSDRKELIKLGMLSASINMPLELARLLCLSLRNMGLIAILDEYSENPKYILEEMGIRLMKYVEREI